MYPSRCPAANGGSHDALIPTAWPDGKRFAFAIFDDTDRATLERVRPVYALLAELGISATKSVWPSRSVRQPINGGDTCEDAAYRDWLLGLQREGFEIGYHLNAAHTSYRAETARGLDRFRDIFGHDPVTMANHTGCRDCIYWGAERVHGANRLVYNMATGFRHDGVFGGHVETDETFWGDLCHERVKYVRNFVFRDTNTLRRCPFMPYHDPATPYVNFWFASADGCTRDLFVERISDANLDRLEAEGGACIMYTHFAFGFTDAHRVDARFESSMRGLSRRNGWFVPVATLLDYLAAHGRGQAIDDGRRQWLERSWLGHKLLTGPS